MCQVRSSPPCRLSVCFRRNEGLLHLLLFFFLYVNGKKCLYLQNIHTGKNIFYRCNMHVYMCIVYIGIYIYIYIYNEYITGIFISYSHKKEPFLSYSRCAISLELSYKASSFVSQSSQLALQKISYGSLPTHAL